MSYYLSYKRV